MPSFERESIYYTNIYIKSGLKAKLSLIYTYNLLQQNIKLSNAKRRWQRERKKKINRLSSNKKTTLHHFFFTAVHFHLAGFSLLTASVSPFLTADIKFSCCFSNKIRHLCFLSLVLALYLFSHVKCRD